MKKFAIASLLLIFNTLFANALSLEKKILGTWSYNISSLIPPESVEENNTRVLITFMNGDNGEAKNGWLQFKMTIKLDNFVGLPQKFQKYNKKATLEFEHTKHVNFKWHIANGQLISSVVSIDNYFSDFQFKPYIEVGEDFFEDLSNFYTQLSKPSSEERKGMELMINSPVRFDQNDNLVLLYDNSELAKAYNEQPFSTEFTNTRYATIKYQNPNSVDNPYNYSYTENGYTYDPDETAFLYLYIWDENGNILNDTDNLSGTYYCMADNEGVWSNMAKIRIGDLSLEAKCFEAENEQQKRIVIESSDSKLITDRYKKLGDNHYRIMVGDKVEFKVTDNGVDITDNIQLKTTTGINVPKVSYFKTPGTYKIYAQVGDKLTNFATIEVMDILYFDITPETIIQGYGATFTAYNYDKSKLNKIYPADITIRNSNSKVVRTGNGFSRLATIGAHQFFAATDKVCSASKSVNVVASDLALFTDRYFSKELNRYLMKKNTNVRFKVVQNGQDITSKANVNIFDQNNKIVYKTKYLGEPGIYQFIATDGFSYSNNVVVDVRGQLWLNAKDITNKDFKDKGYADVKLEATQDKQDVTNSCEFLHRIPLMNWEPIQGPSTTISGKGWHYFKAIRDKFYESNIAIIRVRDKSPEYPSQNIKIFVDNDTITIGETINFKTYPDDAKVYEDDKKIDKVHTPKTPGLHIYHAQKGDLFSEPVSVYVKPLEEVKDEVKEEPKPEPEPTPQHHNSSPTLELYVDRSKIELSNSANFKVRYNGRDCTSKAIITCESSNEIVGTTFTPNSIGTYTFKASIFGIPSNSITVTVVQNRWVGTYQATTPLKIVYDSISAPRIIEDPETFEFSIEYDNGFHIYGLSKENPQYSIAALKITDNHLSLTGSHLTKKSSINSDSIAYGLDSVPQPCWVFTMRSTNVVDSLKYYTTPAFANPYILSLNKNGEISCLQTDMILSETNGKFISVDIFNVNRADRTISPLNETTPAEYRAGNILNIKKISSEVKRFPAKDSEFNNKAVPTGKPNQEIKDFLTTAPTQ